MPLPNCEEEPSYSISRALVATVALPRKLHTCAGRYSMLSCSRFFRGAYILLRVLAVTERSQEALWGFLTRSNRQPSIFVLSGPGIVITNVATASAFLADGWSTESVSRAVITARTTQEKHEKERAEHAYYSHIHDEVPVYDTFPATIQKLDEDENLPEDTTAQDDQVDETEQSLSESLQTRRQISRIHENMGHPSSRTFGTGVTSWWSQAQIHSGSRQAQLWC